jgi:hypothetical protein
MRKDHSCSSVFRDRIEGKMMLGSILLSVCLGLPTVSLKAEATACSVPVAFEREAELQDQDVKEFKVQAKAPFALGVRDGGAAVIRNAKDLAARLPTPKKDKDDSPIQRERAATAFVAKILQVKGIDWDKQMLISIGGGPQKTGGYSVEIGPLKVEGDTLKVHWKLQSPQPNDPVTEVITYPAQTVLLDRFDGKIVFVPPAKGQDKSSDIR